MPFYIWIALAVFIVAIAGGVALAVACGLETWQTFRAVRRRLRQGVNAVLVDVAAAEKRLSGLGEAAGRFARARARLQGSLAEAKVTAAAAGDARAALRVLGYLLR